MEKELLEYLKGMESRINDNLSSIKQDLTEVKNEVTEFRKDATDRLIRLEESATDTAEIVSYINNELIDLKRDFLQVESTTISNWSAINKIKSSMQ